MTSPTFPSHPSAPHPPIQPLASTAASNTSNIDNTQAAQAPAKKKRVKRAPNPPPPPQQQVQNTPFWHTEDGKKVYQHLSIIATSMRAIEGLLGNFPHTPYTEAGPLLPAGGGGLFFPYWPNGQQFAAPNAQQQFSLQQFPLPQQFVAPPIPSAANEQTEAETDDAPKKKRKRSKRDPNAPPQPRTAYNEFLKAKASELKGFVGEGQTMGHVAGDTWRKMTEEEKKPYEDLAAAARAEYKIKKAEYQERKNSGLLWLSAGPVMEGDNHDMEEEEEEEEDEGEEESNVAPVIAAVPAAKVFKPLPLFPPSASPIVNPPAILKSPAASVSAEGGKKAKHYSTANGTSSENVSADKGKGPAEPPSSPTSITSTGKESKKQKRKKTYAHGEESIIDE